MVKKKRNIIIIAAVVVAILALVAFLFLRTPSPISTLKNETPNSITVFESIHGPVFGDIESRSACLTETAEKEEFIALLQDANLKHNYAYTGGGIAYSGVAKRYSITFDYTNKYLEMDITIYDGYILVFLDGQTVSFGPFGSDKYEGEKVEFMEKLLNMVEDDFVVVE